MSKGVAVYLKPGQRESRKKRKNTQSIWLFKSLETCHKICFSMHVKNQEITRLFAGHLKKKLSQSLKVKEKRKYQTSNSKALYKYKNKSTNVQEKRTSFCLKGYRRRFQAHGVLCLFFIFWHLFLDQNILIFINTETFKVLFLMWQTRNVNKSVRKYLQTWGSKFMNIYFESTVTIHLSVLWSV